MGSKAKIFIALVYGVFIVFSILIYREIELSKLKFTIDNQKKLEDCIVKVQERYLKVAKKGAGILNNEEIKLLKTESNNDENRCIKQYK